MRVLTWYVLREHFAPFIFAFATITFLLVIEHVPKVLDHVIDKDLSIWVAFELLGLNLAWMLALSIPMSVLVATLMAFGRMSSDMEIIALKASGVNLIYLILPLFVMGGLITFGMIQFNDKVLPDLNQKARLLWGDIAAMRPTLVFRPGIFVTEVPGYTILLEDINHLTSRVTGVRITETTEATRPRIIVADSGYLETIDNGQSTQFTLYSGELHSLDLEEPANYRKLEFTTQVFLVEGTGSELQRSDSEYRSDREMTIGQLREYVDKTENAAYPSRSQITDYLDTKFDYLLADSFAFSVDDSLSDSAALALVVSDAGIMQRHIGRSNDQIAAQTSQRDRYRLEIYKKYAIPAASLAFILVGAPLGVLTRRGGMGVAIAISIVIFIIYWAFLMGGEDLADRGIVSPLWAMWAANILLGFIGLYLIIKVITEKPVFAWIRGL